MSTTATRQRRPSTGAPISDLQGPVGPASMSRPKHKRTVTGFGPGEIKSVEGIFTVPAFYYPSAPAMLLDFICFVFWRMPRSTLPSFD
jgi:hypothetical protein